MGCWYTHASLAGKLPSVKEEVKAILVLATSVLRCAEEGGETGSVGGLFGLFSHAD